MSLFLSLLFQARGTWLMANTLDLVEGTEGWMSLPAETTVDVNIYWEFGKDDAMPSLPRE